MAIERRRTMWRRVIASWLGGGDLENDLANETYSKRQTEAERPAGRGTGPGERPHHAKSEIDAPFWVVLVVATAGIFMAVWLAP